MISVRFAPFLVPLLQLGPPLSPVALPRTQEGPPRAEPAAVAPPRAPRDPQAERWLERALDSFLGPHRLSDHAAMRFTYEIREGVVTKSVRTTTVELGGSRVRFDLDTKRGHLTVVADLADMRGVALENDEPVPDRDREAVVRRAVGYAMNDVVWVTLPYRAADPSVPIALGPDLSRDGRRSKRLRLTLGDDRYTLLVHEDDAAIHGFEWRPHGLPANLPDFEFSCEGRRLVDGIALFTEFHQAGGVQAVFVRGVEFFDEVPASLFEALPPPPKPASDASGSEEGGERGW